MGAPPEKNFFLLLYCYDWVYTEGSAFASLAEFTYPYVIKLVHCLLNDCRGISQYACLEVTFVFAFHANTGTSKVCAANIHLFAVEDKHFEMNARTKHSLQAVIEYRVLVKILPKSRTRFFRMNEPNLHSLVYELGYERKEWFLLLAHLHIEVFDVGCANSKRALHGLNP